VDDALSLLEDERSVRVAKLHTFRAKALSNLGRARPAIDAYEHAIALYIGAGDAVAAGAAGSALAAIHVWNADGDSAIAATARAIDTLGDAAPTLKCQLLMGLARCRSVAQQPDAGFAALERARELQQSIHDPRLDRRAIAFEAHMRYQAMQLQRALALANEAVQRAHEAQEVWLEVDTAWLSTLIPMFTGQPHESRRLAVERLPLAERVGHHSVVWLCRRALASVLAYGAHLDDAERAGREVMAFGRAMKIPWAFHDNLALALLSFFKDRRDEAFSQLQTAIALEPASYQQGMSASTLFLIRAHLGDAGALDELRKHNPPLPVPGTTPTYGAWVTWGSVVEGFALLGRTTDAASLYWAVDDLLATGTSCGMSQTLFKTAAGVAAAGAGEWSRAEELHQQAVVEADAAYPLFQADARIWYAAMLKARSTNGDRAKAAQLLAEALSVAERLAIVPMARRASEQLAAPAI
jgi:tetratricopeptide (TPR) repeat protein